MGLYQNFGLSHARQNACTYLVGDSAVGARAHDGVGHDDPQRRPEGPLRAEAHRDLGVAGEIGAVDALENKELLQHLSS